MTFRNVAVIFTEGKKQAIGLQLFGSQKFPDLYRDGIKHVFDFIIKILFLEGKIRACHAGLSVQERALVGQEFSTDKLLVLATTSAMEMVK